MLLASSMLQVQPPCSSRQDASRPSLRIYTHWTPWFEQANCKTTVTLRVSRIRSSLQPSQAQEILEALEVARVSEDVRVLIARYGYDVVAPLWQRITPAQRGALALARNFDGVIVHELSTQPGQPDPL